MKVTLPSGAAARLAAGILLAAALAGCTGSATHAASPATSAPPPSGPGPSAASPGAPAAATVPLAKSPPVVPAAQRIAATSATFSAIGKPLPADLIDQTAQEDILDYGVSTLWKRGIDGAGVTVAYVVTNPDPGLAATLRRYDAALHLPAAHIRDIALPAPARPGAPCRVQCETSEDRLDAEAIHSMAPYANILFVHPPVPETVGMQGWPQVARAIRLIADRHLADVISVSLGDGEADFTNDPTNPGASPKAAITSLDPAFLDAAAHSIPVLVASGDCGPTDPAVLSDTGQCTPVTGVSADHPSDNPWVTSVGGTIPNPGLATPGGRTAPDALWTPSGATGDAEGAGVSAVYPRPSWQQGIPALRSVTGRAYPDITMDSSDGTSQASPTFAGILALASQLHGADLGNVNAALAAIGPRGKAAGIVDVPAGFTNSAYGVTGYPTGPGYDIASGWGTISAPAFVPALVAQISRQQGGPGRQAAAALASREAAIRAPSGPVTPGQKVTVTGAGFIPGRTPDGTTIRDGYGVYPPLPGEYGSQPPFVSPSSTVPGQTWDHITVTVTGPGHAAPAHPPVVAGPDGNGTVTVTVDTAGLPAGTCTVTISGLLLTQHVSFRIGGPPAA